jgi:hypothetical protein
MSYLSDRIGPVARADTDGEGAVARGIPEVVFRCSNGMSARQLEDQLGVTYKTAWLLTQKLRRSMVDPNREPLEGVVEVDQAEIPFRARAMHSSNPATPGRSSSLAPSRFDRASNQAKPRRKHAKYLDTRSGRLRLAVIADNSGLS